ncbi:MAG: hypothetical protein RLZ32_2517 [Gemmatimonadota bacterium]
MRRARGRAARLAVACLAAGTLWAGPAAAQRAHVLVVAGLSGEPAYRAGFAAAARATREAARTRWGVADSSVIVLTEDSLPVAGVSDGRSTRANVQAGLARLAARARAGDVVLVLLLGHGAGEGAGSRVNLPGPDATAADYAAWLAPLAAQQVVVVNAASGSGDFVPVLAAPGRVVITATRSALERNAPRFAAPFAEALGSDAADTDKDGRLSVLELFRFTRAAVARAYEASNTLQVEHPVLSDSAAAARIAFAREAAPANARVAALLAERQALESALAALRGRKGAMDAAAYEAELERLLVAIAEKTQAIKAAGGTR